MFLKLTAGGELLFEDRQNFRAFKLVVEADRASLPKSAQRSTARRPCPMRTPPGSSRRRYAVGTGVEHDAAWQQNFAAMIEKARPHGWINDEDMTIKAHVEWAAP